MPWPWPTPPLCGPCQVTVTPAPEPAPNIRMWLPSPHPASELQYSGPLLTTDPLHAQARSLLSSMSSWRTCSAAWTPTGNSPGSLSPSFPTQRDPFQCRSEQALPCPPPLPPNARGTELPGSEGTQPHTACTGFPALPQTTRTLPRGLDGSRSHCIQASAELATLPRSFPKFGPNLSPYSPHSSLECTALSDIIYLLAHGLP